MTGPITITDLLNRRSDLSTFVVHLTRPCSNGKISAAEKLEAILTSRTIEARTAMGWMGGLTSAEKSGMKVACFSETPLEHIYSMFQDIKDRKVKMSSYGLAFSKQKARKLGVNPIWYVDMTPGQDGQWEIAKALDALRDLAKADPGGFAGHPVAKILPFIEQMGSWPTTMKEFSWEREWRHLGDFKFSDLDVSLVLCPEAEIADFESLGPYAAVDPSWSLERMIEKIVWDRYVLTVFERRREARRAREAAAAATAAAAEEGEDG